MAENKWEPSAEQCDSLERDISRLTGVPYNLGQTMIVAILRRQHERESGLLKALRRLSAHADAPWWIRAECVKAVVDWEALNAPKVPTLLEAAKAYVAMMGTPSNEASAYATLKAAVEREENGA